MSVQVTQVLTENYSHWELAELKGELTPGAGMDKRDDTFSISMSDDDRAVSIMGISRKDAQFIVDTLAEYLAEERKA